jgi:D-beta-D-heptose 7-phosphate kinase/D-beta-D-heptose 1-phosphate adenosyltransferase
VSQTKTVWLNGCFDLITPAHIELFSVARSLAGTEGRVIVGLDSDKKVKDSKGPTRPINCFSDRKTILESIRYIDLVLEFDDREGLENLVQMIKPDIMLLGGDWRCGDVVGRDYCKDVRFLDRRKGYSSTEVIRRCKDACE